MSSQVERRVVSQLAMAHERQLIEKGSIVNLVVPDNWVAKATTAGGKSAEDEEQSRKEMLTPIKLQLVKKGRFSNQFVDLDLSKSDNPFTTEWLMHLYMMIFVLTTYLKASMVNVPATIIS